MTKTVAKTNKSMLALSRAELKNGVARAIARAVHTILGFRVLRMSGVVAQGINAWG